MTEDSAAVIARRERLFLLLCDAAAKGLRCPPNDGKDIRPEDFKALALDGRIIEQMCGTHWRVIRIVEGPQQGKSTMPDPKGGRCYWICDVNGARSIPPSASSGRQGVRRQPSPPRLLTNSGVHQPAARKVGTSE